MAERELNKSIDDNDYSVYQDPAEYLLSKKEYPDWNITIVNTKSNTEEVIGVHSIHLIAHSSVFRIMMSDPKWANTKNVKISDVRAEVFKLMLRYVYGGKLPKLSRNEVVELMFAADKYFMPRLVKKVGKYLIPTTLEEFFPALQVVICLSCPDLKPHLVNFLQNNTAKIMSSEELLELSGQYWAFILKQDQLNIEEVESWQYLMKWAEQQVRNSPEKTLREVLQEPLKFVRFAAMSLEEIVKEVLPTKVLTDSEILSLQSCIASKQNWAQPGLCNNSTKRKLSTVHVFKACRIYGRSEYYTDPSSEIKSSVIIQPLVNIELLSYLVADDESVSPDVKANNVNGLNCNATLKRCASTDKLITLSFKQADGSFLRLNANETYELTFEFPSGHTAYKLYRGVSYTTDVERQVENVMYITYKSYIHVREIHYRILC